MEVLFFKRRFFFWDGREVFFGEGEVAEVFFGGGEGRCFFWEEVFLLGWIFFGWRGGFFLGGREVFLGVEEVFFGEKRGVFFFGREEERGGFFFFWGEEEGSIFLGEREVFFGREGRGRGKVDLFVRDGVKNKNSDLKFFLFFGFFFLFSSLFLFVSIFCF